MILRYTDVAYLVSLTGTYSVHLQLQTFLALVTVGDTARSAFHDVSVT